MKCRSLVLVLFVFALTQVSVSEAQSLTLARLSGTDFAGGANDLYGSTRSGAWSVNYVYAQPTGSRSTMSAEFEVSEIPDQPMFLHLMGMDDNFPEQAPIAISINDAVILSGSSTFANNEWQWRVFEIPNGALRDGVNRLEIKNTAAEGTTGWPPWFMICFAVIGSEDAEHRTTLPIDEDFRVSLPEEKRPIPEPYEQGEEFSGFQWRGTKGWMWTPEQYLEEIPILADAKMNFLMNCYTSMCDLENFGWGDPRCNEWWKPIDEDKRLQYEQVVRACQEAGIEFCFSMNPNLCSKRFVSARDPKGIDDLWQHYEWMQDLGVRWFNISLDDISKGIDAADQSAVVNEIFSRLRAKDPKAEMIFTPTHYWGTGEEDPYLETLAQKLHEDIFIFWTGPTVVAQEIRTQQAESYRKAVDHRLFIWDNYPVNDGNPALHLGPIVRRDAGLPEIVDGYMSNPMHTQSQINRIPLLTCADYAYNPKAYDPERSIGQAILYNSADREQAEALRDLVELYPGMIIYNSSATNLNTFQARLAQILSTPHSRYIVKPVLEHALGVSDRLRTAFPDRFAPARKMLDRDIETFQENYSSKYGQGD